MFDPYIASKIARLEHEERIRSLARVDDHDMWLTHEAGHWQSQTVGSVLSSLRKGLAALANGLKHKPEVAPDIAVEANPAPEHR